MSSALFRFRYYFQRVLCFCRSPSSEPVQVYQWKYSVSTYHHQERNGSNFLTRNGSLSTVPTSWLSLLFLLYFWVDGRGIKGKNTVLLIWGEMIPFRVSLSLITITKWCRIQREPSWQENLAPDQTESCQGISTDKYLDHNCPNWK